MFMINGKVLDTLPVTDRALHYGDGLFETIAVIRGVPHLWSEHMDRLQRGCEVLGLPVPDVQQLYDEVQSLCGSQQQAVVKLIYSRGSGGRGYRLPQQVEPQRILLSYPWPESYEFHHGIRLHLCKTPLACNPALAGIKHLNRLEQVLARAEWSDPDIQEGLMCDLDGRVKEGTMSNLFWVKEGQLYTPDLSRCGVAGVMRSRVMALAEKLHIKVVIDEISPELLKQVDEIFVTNSLIGIWPVRQYEGRDFPAGKLTRRLRDAIENELEIRL